MKPVRFSGKILRGLRLMDLIVQKQLATGLELNRRDLADLQASREWMAFAAERRDLARNITRGRRRRVDAHVVATLTRMTGSEPPK